MEKYIQEYYEKTGSYDIPSLELMEYIKEESIKNLKIKHQNRNAVIERLKDNFGIPSMVAPKNQTVTIENLVHDRHIEKFKQSLKRHNISDYDIKTFDDIFDGESNDGYGIYQYATVSKGMYKFCIEYHMLDEEKQSQIEFWNKVRFGGVSVGRGIDNYTFYVSAWASEG
jgi:hypothetical protein